MLEVVREKIKAVGAENMTALYLDLSKDAPPDEKFDLIHLSMTLHHITDTARILSAFYKLLVSGGSLCVSDFDLDDGSFHADHPEFEGHHGFDWDDMKTKLEEAGFKVQSFETCFMIDKEVGGKVRQYPVFLVHAVKP